jgi:hypothetical protein
VIACVPTGGTAGPLVGVGSDGRGNTDGDVTGGADVTRGDSLNGLAGFTAAELGGPVKGDGAPVSWVLAGVDGGADCKAAAWLR